MTMAYVDNKHINIMLQKVTLHIYIKKPDYVL